MNEEEKEEFKRIKKQFQETWLDDDDIKFLVNSIEKLQKENEKLKALDSSNSKMIANMSKRHFQDREKIRNSIPIQKIKDKIEELNRKINNGGKTYGRYGGCVIDSENIMKLQNQIEVLQQLLEKEG